MPVIPDPAPVLMAQISTYSTVEYDQRLNSFDVGNTAMLNKGADAAKHARDPDGWQPMASAPHDGTVVEVRNNYGVAPWYGLYRWAVSEFDNTGHWFNAKQASHFFDHESDTLMWRPYKGDVTAYVDPTGGAQESMAYWRGASAQASGLPPDAFEELTRKNIAGEAPEPKAPWWQRWYPW